MQNRFFRAGKVDGWRSTLDDSQVRRIVERHSEQMTRFGYVPDGFEKARMAERTA